MKNSTNIILIIAIAIVIALAVAGYFIFKPKTDSESADTEGGDKKSNDVPNNATNTNKSDKIEKIDTTKPEFSRFCGKQKYKRDSDLPKYKMPNSMAIQQFTEALSVDSFDVTFAYAALLFLKGMDLEPRAWIAKAHKNEIKDYQKSVKSILETPIAQLLQSDVYAVGGLICTDTHNGLLNFLKF